MYTLPIQRLKEIASHVVPGSVLGTVKEIKSTQLPRLYILKMTDGRPLLLSITPRLSVRLLRHEATIMASEASIIYFLAESSTSRRSTSPASSRASPRSDDGDSRSEEMELEGLVPKILKHSSNNRETPYPYSILEPTRGTPISMLSPPLSLASRRSVDKQVGSFARALASRKSPCGTFGMANRVLPDPSSNTLSSTAPKLVGSETWSEAFRTLLEAVLRDGEDMSVLLPYETIRAHFRRLSWRLDAVKSPRLAIINVNQDTNVMVEMTVEEDESGEPVEDVELTGLRNWSQGVFGDPLISSCFDSPSKEFLEGWVEGGDEVIEDEENKEGRLLLYQCYRAVVAIVTEYYRPQSDSSKRELEGRRKLTSALKVLDELFNDEDEAIKRVRSMSVDIMSIAKRQKLNEE
ncbi:hypothetical protein IFR04_014769 [Cadophora malorum]|uniref:Uncharacterized protein n=1 Tax=Cadophora malorum TaxID=108018 RepID=A0A8H7W5Z6_9HELO|nr:hypothetical protein IFR04_014769 [Cadophora malorum]